VSANHSRTAALLLASHLWLTACSYIVVLVLARTLGPELYGVYGIVYSVLLSVELIGRFGLPQAVTKLAAEGGPRQPRIEATGFTLSMGVYMLIFAAFWFGAPFLAELFNVPSGARLFRIAALDIPFCGAYLILSQILTSRHAFTAHAAGIGAYALAKIVGIAVLAAIGPTVEGALLINVASSVAGLAVVAATAGRDPFLPTLAESRSILRLAGSVAAISLGLQVLSNIDLWMLNVLVTDSAAVKGDYVASTNVARIPNILAYSLSGMLVPVVARALADNAPDQAAKAINSLLRFMAVVLVPGCAIVAVNAGEILALLFSSSYSSGAPILAVLIFAQGCAYTIYMALANLLIATGQADASAKLALGLVVFAAIVSALLVTVAGALGAAWSSLVTTAVALVAVAAVLRSKVPLKLTLAQCLRIAAVAAVVAAVGWWLRTSGFTLLAELAFLGVLMVAALWMLGLITGRDVEPFVPAKAQRLRTLLRR
jgi:O-antigen/teichoic acid export membrane protein